MFIARYRLPFLVLLITIVTAVAEVALLRYYMFIENSMFTESLLVRYFAFVHAIIF